MLSLLAAGSTKGVEYLIAIVFLVVFLLFLRIFTAPDTGKG